MVKTRIEEANNSITMQDKQNINNMLHITNFSIGMMLDNKYEIKREIAKGGMGIVYEAYDHLLHRQVAIKIILGNKIDTLQLKRFQKEIEACARLSHPNVIKIYDAGTYENNPYIVMEYIDGVNICEYVIQNDEAYRQQSEQQELENTEKKERDWKLCAKLIYESALGLEYIHKQKMFHRDIKPSNIMVRSTGSPVIIDMGLVKFNQERSYNLTRSRDIIGTCQYMPMEQVQGKHGKVDARSDVYSLGLVLYELITEQQAYTGKNATEVFNKIASYYPPLPRESNPQIPEVLEEITMHAIEKQKEKRYATAQEFADALKQYLDGTTTRTTTQYANYKKRLLLQRNKNKIVASCVALLLVSIIIISMIVTKETSVAKKLSQNQEKVQNDAETQYQLGLMYERGIKVKQDYKKAFECYEKATNQGYIEAQYKLALLYYNGQGVEQNFLKAFESFEQLANQKHAEAQNMLALLYYNGQGVEQNFSKAFEILDKSENQKNAEAQYLLGLLYYNGQGVEQNFSKAFEWLEQSGNQGHAEAQNMLGLLYGNGKGVEKDYNKAFEWYKKAANQGNAKAQHNLGVLYENGKGIKKNLRKAFEWYERAANQGNAEAQNMLGLLYENGKGIPKNMGKAWEWYQRAANQGYIDAQYNIATLYLEGKEVQQNLDQAISLYEKIANQGYAEAQYRLGFIYEKGISVYQDIKKAIYWYEKASNNGHADAQDRLGLIYYKDKNYKDYDKAKELFEKAAIQDHPNSLYCLGIMYNFGYGVPQDYTKAFYYFDKTAPKLSWSKYYLAELYYNGYGVEWDYEKARDLYQKAMKEDYHLGEVKLVKLQEREKQLLRQKNSLKKTLDNIKPGNKQAIIALQQLAFLNIPEAQYHLGVLYAQGIIFQKNIEKATILLTKAAQQGYKEAEEYLQNMKSSND